MQNIVYLDDHKYAVDEIKKGGMGKVWLLTRSHDEDPDPFYRPLLAVKTFDNNMNIDDILKELNIWISLKHENILSLRKIGKLNFQIAAIMPRRFSSLQDELKQVSVFPKNDVINIAIQIAEALNYAFINFKLVHLDLKPSNILVNSSNPIRIEVADWGISRIGVLGPISQKWLSSANFTSDMSGTPPFMAPERFTRHWKLNPSVDIFSLGMLCLQILTGSLPFKNKIVSEIISGEYFETARLLISKHSDVLSSFILDCLAPNILNRPNDYKTIIQRLKSLINE